MYETIKKSQTVAHLAYGLFFPLLVLDSISLDVFGFNVKVYHVYLLLLLYLSLLVGLKNRTIKSSVDPLFGMFMLYGLYNTVYVSAFPSFSENRLIIISFFFIAYIYISNVQIKEEFLIRIISVTGCFVCIVSVLQLVLKYALGFSIHLYMDGRPQAFFSEPDWLGYFFLFTIPYSLYAVEKHKKYSMFTMNLFGLILSQTRAAWVAVVVVLACYYLFTSKSLKKRYRRIIIIACSIVMIFLLGALLFPSNFIFMHYSDRITNIINPNHETSRYRIQILQTALKMGNENPFFGLGLDNFGSHFVEYSGMDYGIHTGLWNMYINMYFELGVIGVILFGLFLMRNLFVKFMYFKRSHNQLMKFNLISICMMLVANNFSNGFYFLFFWINLAIGNCLMYSASKRLSSERD